MPLDPGGHGVDMLRSCYSTRARLWPGYANEVTIHWYFADAGKPPLPFPTFCGSRNWTQSKDQPSAIGEVFDAPHKYSKGAKPAFASDTIRGTPAEFARGLQGPIMAWATCTPAAIEIGGGAGFAWFPPLVGLGGVELGGGALFNAGYHLYATGGIEVNSTADMFLATAGLGGIEVGGPAFHQSVDGGGGPGGGVEVGGPGFVTPVEAGSQSGVEVGGDGDVFPAYLEATGGIEINSTSGFEWEIVFPTTGDCSAMGTAAETWTTEIDAVDDDACTGCSNVLLTPAMVYVDDCVWTDPDTFTVNGVSMWWDVRVGSGDPVYVIVAIRFGGGSAIVQWRRLLSAFDPLGSNVMEKFSDSSCCDMFPDEITITPGA